LTAVAERCRLALTSEKRQELANTLGLPEVCLSALGVGWCETGPHYFEDTPRRRPCFVFPEQDASGAVIGLTGRYPNGAKICWPGGRRGLFVPTGWRQRGGALYLPEGPSDVLTLWALGLSAIGRPSNTGGVTLLGELLADQPLDRPIIVLGELDPKPDGKWP